MVKVKKDDGRESYIILKYYEHYELPDGTIRVIFPRGLEGTVIPETDPADIETREEPKTNACIEWLESDNGEQKDTRSGYQKLMEDFFKD